VGQSILRHRLRPSRHYGCASSACTVATRLPKGKWINISTPGQGDGGSQGLSSAVTQMNSQTLYGVRARVLFSGLGVQSLEVAQPETGMLAP
jgi:hypothetical protein